MIASIKLEINRYLEAEINKRDSKSLYPNSIYARITSKNSYPYHDVYVEEDELLEILKGMEKIKK